jgi:glycerophosphoryl diester phosphodiesterase
VHVRRPPSRGCIAIAGIVGSGTLVRPSTRASAADRPEPFDVQAHRGGLGLRVENTLASFGNALQVGVSALELDVQITEDGYAVVTHDRRTTPVKCSDTGRATSVDPEYPYAERYINTSRSPRYAHSTAAASNCRTSPASRSCRGARMPLLSEVFDLVKRYDADDVVLNVETKVEAGHHRRPAGPVGRQAGASPDAGPGGDTAPYDVFIRLLVTESQRAGFVERVTIQSFDWRTTASLPTIRRPLITVAIRNGLR